MDNNDAPMMDDREYLESFTAHLIAAYKERPELHAVEQWVLDHMLVSKMVPLVWYGQSIIARVDICQKRGDMRNFVNAMHHGEDAVIVPVIATMEEWETMINGTVDPDTAPAVDQFLFRLSGHFGGAGIITWEVSTAPCETVPSIVSSPGMPEVVINSLVSASHISLHNLDVFKDRKEDTGADRSLFDSITEFLKKDN